MLQEASPRDRAVQATIKRALDGAMGKIRSTGRRHGQPDYASGEAAIRGILWMFVVYATHYMPALRNKAEFLRLCASLHDDAAEASRIEQTRK